MRSKIIRFAVGDATGGLFTQAWTYLLPILITASLGASANALFYTSFLFSSTIDQVAANYASPLTVEGAHAPDKIAMLIRLALRHIFAIILPVVTALVIVCPWLLRAFGDKYVSAVPLLDMLLIACLPRRSRPCTTPTVESSADSQICNYAGVRMHSYAFGCRIAGSLIRTNRCRSCRS